MDEEPSPIKDILYDEISKISNIFLKENLVNNSPIVIEKIIDSCKTRVLKLELDKVEALGILCESMMHYILTETLIPSMRKITMSGIYLDIIIPDAKTMSEKPEESLVLYFAKTADIKKINDELKRIKMIQPFQENVFVVTKNLLDLETREYEIEGNKSICNILQDIKQIVDSRKQNRFAIFKS